MVYPVPAFGGASPRTDDGSHLPGFEGAAPSGRADRGSKTATRPAAGGPCRV